VWLIRTVLIVVDQHLQIRWFDAKSLISQ
jgi:hypothetical protein